MSASSGNSGSDGPSGRQGGRKRPRRRRGRGDRSEGGSEGREREPQPGTGDSKASSGDKRQRHRGRRRRGKKPGTDSAAELLATKPKTVDLQKDVEEPLSSTEVAALREHFRFLRDHRKELRLKVNAAEDLLLNGVREPTHRGVCQHLLGKVDRSSVLGAASRLDPAAAAGLLAGVIRFSADIEYVLLFLEKIKLSSSSQQATAALAQGLARIDFDRVSSAQMRRVLSLITELFPERDRPELLLGLLESRSFREAFDSSVEGLPEPLMRLVVPLRAVQAVVLHGKPNRYAPEILAAGIRLLLTLDVTSLRRRSAETRQRLFFRGLEVCTSPDHPHHRSLEVLLASLAKDDRQHRENGLALGRHLLAAELDDDARKVLKGLAGAHPDFQVPARWLKRLEPQNRIDRFAIDDKKAERRDVLGHHRRVAGHCLNTMRPVWIQIGNAQDDHTHTAAATLLDELTMPGVVPLLASGVTPQGAPYFATPSPGQALDHAIQHKGGLSLSNAVSLCLEGATLLAALGGLGVRLPDAAPQRFERSAEGSLWLVDAAGLERAANDETAAANLRAARHFCDGILEGGRRYLPPADLLAAVRAARSLAELVRWLARSSLLAGRS